jgi:hypothetical protein
LEAFGVAHTRIAVSPDAGIVRYSGAVIATLIVLFCAAAMFPSDAHAAAVFSQESPANESTVPGAPTYISVYADDDSAILDTTSMTINGSAVPVTLDYPGHWEDPDCQENWVVDDWTAATISTYGRILTAEGTYTVEVTVRTQSSGTSVYSWTFTIIYPEGSEATFWSSSPAAGSTLTASAALSSWVGSPNGIPYNGLKFYLDDVAHYTYHSAGSYGSMLGYTAALTPPDGLRSVRLGAMDTIGVYTEKLWTYTVQIKPTLSLPTPYGGASYTGLRPDVGLTLTDNTPGTLHLRFVVDGIEVFNGQTSQGAFRWSPPYDLEPGVNHTAAATVTDGAGNVQTLNWEFKDSAMFRSESPSIDATIGGSPGQVAVYVDAASTILSGARMYVNGVPVTTSMEWQGHWEGDDCESWWVVDDYTAATISAPSGVLTEGVHTITVEVDTELEGTLTHSWSFVIEYVEGTEATFSNRDPAPGSTVTGYPTLKVSIVSPTSIYRHNIYTYINDVRVPCTTSQYVSTSQNVSVSSSYFTGADGPYTVKVTALNESGVLSVDTWSFQTQIAPLAYGPYPTTTAPAHEPRPQIGLCVSDNGPGLLRLRFKLDGVTQFDGQVEQDIFRYTPTTDFTDGSNHAVVVDVWDAAGNTKNLSWTFDVIALPAMSDADRCTACHIEYPGVHPFTTCNGCHVDDPEYDPHGPNRYAPLGTCDCHGYSYNHPSSSVSDCKYCHTNTNWIQIPRHDLKPVTGHQTTTTGCTACHDVDLITEHSKYPADSPFKSQCSTCHVNENPPVKTSVANHVTDCYACHIVGDPHHVVADLSALAEPGGLQCSVCHSHLTQEHFKPTSSSVATGCDACHALGGARSSIIGAWNQACDTAGCHDDASTGRAVHENYCLACHDVGQPDFSVSKTSFPPVAEVNRDTACASCHLPGFVGAHPYHQIGSNCAAACHLAWGPSKLTATPRYSDPVSGAAFSSADSKETSSAILHTIHSQPRWPATVDTDFSACASCHAVAACNACHTGAMPIEHKVHSSVGSTNYPAVEPWTGEIGRGVLGGDQTQHTNVVEQVQCGAVGCHDLNASAAREPALIEDGDVRLTVTGTWRSRWDSRYSAGRMSYSNNSTTQITAPFDGARIELISDLDPYRGLAEVLIDGSVAGTFDGYSPFTSTQVVVFSADLAPGAHTITVRPLGTSNPSARAAYVVVDAFRVHAHAPADAMPTCGGCHADRTNVHW